MKVGGWLSAKEALEWGFVDEITDIDDEPAPKLTDSLASAMASAGMPIPNIPIAEPDREGVFAKFLNAIAAIFKSNIPISNTIPTAMKKTYQFVCAVLGLAALDLVEDKATLTDEQLTALENHIADLGKKVDDKDKALADKDAEIADLKARLEKAPAASTTSVVEDNKPTDTTPKNDVEAFVQTYNSARQLYNEV